MAVKKKQLRHDELYDADTTCKHDIEQLWSGIRCRKCHGWFCF